MLTPHGEKDCSGTPRAAASSLAARRQHKAAVRPVLALQPQAASAWLRAGPLFELTPALKGIGLKLSVDYCSNFNRFSLLGQALV